MADFTLKGSRPRGWILLILGLFLAVSPAALIFGWVPILTTVGGVPLLSLDGAGPEELLLMLLLAVVTGFGAATAAYGVYQISTGRPNRSYMRLLVRLLSAMMFLILVLSLAETLLG